VVGKRGRWKGDLDGRLPVVWRSETLGPTSAPDRDLEIGGGKGHGEDYLDGGSVDDEAELGDEDEVE